MKLARKRIWLTVALVGAFAIVVGLLWRKEPPQIITLPGGEQYQFVAAEWGTSLVQPTFAARMVARLPDSLADFIVRKWRNRLGIVTPVGSASRYITWIGPMPKFPPPPPEPSLRLWFRFVNTNAVTRGFANFRFMLADKNGVIAGNGKENRNGGWSTAGQGTNKWLTFTFPVVPRRSDTLQLYMFQPEVHSSGPYLQTGTIRFRNPLFGHFPSWQPEPLPATKMAGDLKLQLTDLSIAAAKSGMSINGMYIPFRSPDPSEDRKIVFKLDIKSPRGTNETWLIQPEELSDATGNRVCSGACFRWPGTNRYSFGPALWPDESAWRLKLTLRRSRGLDPEELVTFTNIPVPAVGATNTVLMTNRIHGVPVVLRQEFSRPFGQEARCTAEFPEKPDSMAVDFMELSADTGWKVTGYDMVRSDLLSVILERSIPTNAATVNITWAVQKTRTVEFLVKPPKAE